MIPKDNYGFGTEQAHKAAKEIRSRRATGGTLGGCLFVERERERAATVELLNLKFTLKVIADECINNIQGPFRHVGDLRVEGAAKKRGRPVVVLPQKHAAQSTQQSK